jgi:uncharacterized protein (TIGR03086 family)
MAPPWDRNRSEHYAIETAAPPATRLESGMDQIENFTRAVDQTGRIVAAVRPDQLAGATPCAEWDVRALLNHTIGGVHMFDDAAQEKAFDTSRFQRDMVGTDPAESYAAGAAKLKETLRQPDVLDGQWTMPFGATPGQIAIGIATVEMLQHGWDVARATGQQAQFDPELGESAMATARMMPPDIVRQPGVFGPEADCASDAPIEDRLAAFLGRPL